MTNTSSARVVVYSKPLNVPGIPNCQPCIATARKLDQHGIEHEKRDATAPSSLAYLRTEFPEHNQAPVVIVYGENGEILDDWSGYRPDKIDTLKAA